MARMGEEHEDLRLLRVSVSRFNGMGAHVWVKVRPDPTTADPDPEERMMKFRRRDRAVQWVEHIARVEFDLPEHAIVWDHRETIAWWYGEGD